METDKEVQGWHYEEGTCNPSATDVVVLHGCCFFLSHHVMWLCDDTCGTLVHGRARARLFGCPLLHMQIEPSFKPLAMPEALSCHRCHALGIDLVYA